MLVLAVIGWFLFGLFTIHVLGLKWKGYEDEGSRILCFMGGFLAYIIANIIGLFCIPPLSRKSNIKQIALAILFPVVLLRTFLICPAISFFTEVKNSESTNEFANKVRDVLEYQPFIEDEGRKRLRLEAQKAKLQIELDAC